MEEEGTFEGFLERKATLDVFLRGFPRECQQ